MILCDAGVLLCFVDPTQTKHKLYSRKLISLNQPLITTWSCLTEAMYLALHRGGWQMQKYLWQILLDGLLLIYDIQISDYIRLQVLMEQYSDRPMDLADATLVLTAEKTGYRQIMTLDTDFLFYRINNQDNFDIIQVE